MARNASTPETASAEKAEKKNYQVNGTISADLYKALEDHRWDARIDRFPKLVAKALEEYAENHGLTVGTPAETPGE